MLEICFGEFCFNKAFIVALITLCALEVPIDFATMSLTPKTSQVFCESKREYLGLFVVDG